MTKQFKQLSDFILNQMKMSHIYQPVMLIELLNQQGSASTTEIAKALLSKDISQIEYYKRVTKNMVGRVLTNRGIISKDKNQYSLIGYDDLSNNEKIELIKFCEERIEDFLQKRDNKIWTHRSKSFIYISGTLRYEVFKRAKYRCELCGTSAAEKALQVDHIVPRNFGGSDEQTNLQALCYSCNAMKRDKDDTDFRQIDKLYGQREIGCTFCEFPSKRIISENELAYAILDAFPVTEQHTLIIPKRHMPDYFSLFQPEKNAIDQLLEEQRQKIIESDRTVTGFNVGNNIGQDAGQTVMHCHTHLIPRRRGDVEEPRGGVRGVIPARQDY
jgi:diadenosine tetraphosphate (Ap4A) HIT family hydrolase